MGKQLTAVGAYIFAGGFTEGVKAAGFKVLSHLEEWQFGVATARANNPGLDVRVTPGDQAWPLDGLRGADLVFANPPCAPWSSAAAGRERSWRDDPRTSCWTRTFGLLKTLRPTVWICESVRQAFTVGRSMMDDLVAKARRLGYAATHLLVDGQDHGLPQRRRRYFLVLSKVEIEWRPTGKRPVTVGEVLAKVDDPGWHKPMKPEMLELARRTEPGRSVRRTFDRLNARRVSKAKLMQERAIASEALAGGVRQRQDLWIEGRPNFLTTVLNPDAVCGVVIGNNKIHPSRKRMIGIEEAKALCGYPRRFRFECTNGRMFAELTKAVMPPVAEHACSAIADAIRRGRRADPRVAEVVEIGRRTVERRPA